MKATSEANQAVVQGSVAYVGKYTVDEKEQTVTQFVEGSTFPNGGETPMRFYTVTGDELRVTTATTASAELTT